MEQYLGSCLPVWITVIIILSVWELVWKYVAMWKAGRNNHMIWFICLAVFNTAGILPIIYIILQRKNRKERNQVREG
jgi:predicted Co/Zn/Cd cation transporter (cation efflux family)